MEYLNCLLSVILSIYVYLRPEAMKKSWISFYIFFAAIDNEREALYLY